MSAIGGGFNRSTQHLLILPDEEVCAWRGMHGHGMTDLGYVEGKNFLLDFIDQEGKPERYGRGTIVDQPKP
jgi:hypothetical protein